MSDGSIIIDTRLRTGGITPGLRQIEKQIDSLTSKFDRQVQSIRAQENALSAMRMKLQAIADSDVGISSLIAMEAQQRRNTKEIEAQQRAYDEVIAKIQETNSQLAFARGIGDSLQIETAVAQLDRLESESLQAADTLGTMEENSARLAERIAEIRLDPTTSQEAINLSNNIGLAEERLATTREEANATNVQIQQLFSQRNAGTNETINDISSGVNTIANGAKRAGSSILRAVGYMASLGKQTKNTGNHARSATNMFDKMARRIKAMIMTVAIYQLMRNALRGLRDSLGRVLMANEDFARSVNAIKVNLLTAFAPLWQVIEPAFVSFMQVLAQVTSKLAAFMAMIFGQTAEQAQKSAEAIYNQGKALDKTAKSADKAGKGLQRFDDINQAYQETAAEGAGTELDFAAVEPPDISWLDELKKKLEELVTPYERAYAVGEELSKQLVNWLKSIDWEAIKETAKVLAERLAGFLNGFIDNEEMWSELGRAMGEGINTALEFLETFIDKFHWKELGKGLAIGLNKMVATIDWEKLGRTFGKGINGFVTTSRAFFETTEWGNIGESITTFLNTSLETIKWDELGRSLADPFNALIDTLNPIVKNFKWSELGKSLSDSINGFIDEIKWDELGQTISGLFTGVLDFLISALEEFDWKELGIKIRDFIINIEWDDIANKIGNAVGLAFKGIADLVFNLIAGDMEESGENSATAFFKGLINISKIPPNLIAEFITGISKAFGLGSEVEDKFKEIATLLLRGFFGMLNPVLWVANVVDFAKWIIDKFKEIFGIHSPSTVFAEIGENVMKGLLGGIKDFIQPILDVFDGLITFITGVFTGDWEKAWEGVKEIFKGVWNGIVTILEGAANLIISGINLLIKALNKIKIDIPATPFTNAFSIGIDLPELSELKIPRLARGGIVDSATVAMIGERGREAVMPLENNTGWITDLANQIGAVIGASGVGGSQQMQVILNIDGREFAQAIVDPLQAEQSRIGINMIPRTV